ncbi:hypothetical protein CW306_04175 [Bacillus sp. BA3]|nr:hypothetical protein CW306_04175 [Bacillus sp. BA3]
MIGSGVRDSCGKSASRGDPAQRRRGGSRTARRKRVLEATFIAQTIKKLKTDSIFIEFVYSLLDSL